MDWFYDARLCQRKIDDLKAQPAFVEVGRIFEAGGELSQPQVSLMTQMERFCKRLAELKGEAELASGKRKRQWEDAVDMTQLPGSDRSELMANSTTEKDKGLRMQYQEVKHHYVAHSATGLALATARKALEGESLPEEFTQAVEFIAETAEKGIARARARAKTLAMVQDRGADLGWDMADILEKRPYADDEDDDKNIRKAEKLAKAAKAQRLADAKSKKNKGRNDRNDREHNRNREAQPRAQNHQANANMMCFNCSELGHHQNDCPRRRHDNARRGNR